jgi:hypothetical protein
MFEILGMPRGRKRKIPLEKRAYYTRAEACIRFGFSATRFKELVAHDETLPMLNNGRNQLFPKDLMERWFEALAQQRSA